MSFIPPPTVIDQWLGNETTRNAGRGVLTRNHHESYYNYLTRWLEMKRFRLEWKVDFYPAAPLGRQTIFRPIINGCVMAPCYCGLGDDARAAKEEACRSLVEAVGCKL